MLQITKSLIELKGQRDKSISMVIDFSTPLSVIDRIIDREINKHTDDLNNSQH